MSGFEVAYCLHGGDAHKLTLAIKSGQSANVVAGTLVELDTGEATVAATASTDFLGVCTGQTKDGKAVVVVDPDAVYRVTDASARLIGAPLDIATGARGVTTSSNANLVVVGQSPAGANTLVKIADNHHAFRVN